MSRLSRYVFLVRSFVRGGGYRRAEFLRKHQYFKAQGEHCYLQPWNYGTEPHMISFGNNVHVASGVTFINHDVSVFMLRHLEPETEFKARTGEITIGNNVFIGAGSIVTKDIPDDVVAVGLPCKPIGNFDDWKEKMKAESHITGSLL